MPNKFRIAVRKFDPFETFIQKVWQSFCIDSGCKLELEAIPMDLHPLYESTLGEQNGLQNGDWDVGLISTDWISEAQKHQKIINLNLFLEENPPDDFPHGWPQALLGMQNFNDQIYGLPFHDGPECLIYRKDLFENENEKLAFKKAYGRELAPPRTWDESLEVAHFFQRPEEGLYGTVLAAFPDGHNTVFDLCLQIWARGGEIINDDGNVNVDTKIAEEGLAYYIKLSKDKNAIHPESSMMDSVKSGMAFARGEVAFMVNWFGFAAMCEVDEISKVKGCVDIIPVPTGKNGKGVSLNVYWMYTIGAGSKNKKVAYDFIRFAVNAQNDKLLTLEGGIGCRKSTWNDKEINISVPYYHKLNFLHNNSYTLPRKAHWVEIAVVIDEIVMSAMSPDQSIKKILENGQIKIKAIEEKHA